jgi:hypothetical protein
MTKVADSMGTATLSKFAYPESAHLYEKNDSICCTCDDPMSPAQIPRKDRIVKDMGPAQRGRIEVAIRSGPATTQSV